jgi:hypothetical protein
MIWVGRIAIEADVDAIPMQLDLPLRRFVARLAQTLQFASDEGGPVAPVRDDVIDHVGRRDDSALKAELAQWFLSQLQSAQPSPTRRFVEVGHATVIARLLSSISEPNQQIEPTKPTFGTRAALSHWGGDAIDPIPRHRRPVLAVAHNTAPFGRCASGTLIAAGVAGLRP